MKMIESFTGFQPLEEVWIGGVYPEKFYQHLPNEVEDMLCKITEKTTTAFNTLEKKLQSLGVIVRKPHFKNSVDCYLDQFDNLIKPPVAPRDWAITLGNELWIIPQGYKLQPYAHVINEYIRYGEKVEILDRSKDPRAWLEFPGIVRAGTRIIVDTCSSTDSVVQENIQRAIKYLEKDYKVILTREGAHLDGVFCPIKQGYIFSSHWGNVDLYKKTFPNWNVFWKEKNLSNGYNGRWWVEENNFYSPIFNKYIEEKASNWVGNASETVFEVNILVIDEKNIICLAHDEHSFEQMSKIGIEPHVIDFPTRGFWDGGIHCITVDIRRSGGKQNYF